MSGVQTASSQEILPHHCLNNDKRDEDPEHRFEMDQAGGKQRVVHLDSEEFTRALEDKEFRSDLRRACQRAFMKCHQSTHSSWEDLQQEVLMRFGKWLPQYRAEANRRTVFERIATNVLIDAKRRETAKRRFHEEIDLDDLQHDIVGNNPWKGIETRIFLNECRNSLSDAECQILDEYFVEGCSLRQIAKNLGLSAPAISKRLGRIVAKLYEHQKLARMSIAEAA